MNTVRQAVLTKPPSKPSPSSASSSSFFFFFFFFFLALLLLLLGRLRVADKPRGDVMRAIQAVGELIIVQPC